MGIRGLILTGAALALPVSATQARAQEGFMFGQPNVQVTVRAGPVLSRAGGDLFDFFTSELTLERGDFRAPAVGADLAVVLHPRFDLALGIAWSESESSSESREWLGEDDLPIEQVTRFRLIPFTASLRFYPLSRGESVGRLAWVPARTTPYLGGGAGMTWYRLAQEGEFVDEGDLSIFRASFESSGNRITTHVLAGVDHWFSPRFALNLEGRYHMGSARPRDDFEGWEEIDLSGFQVGAGVSFRWSGR